MKAVESPCRGRRSRSQRIAGEKGPHTTNGGREEKGEGHGLIATAIPDARGRGGRCGARAAGKRPRRIGHPRGGGVRDRRGRDLLAARASQASPGEATGALSCAGGCSCGSGRPRGGRPGRPRLRRALPQPAQLGPLGRRRPGGRRQPDHAREAGGGGRAGPDRAHRVAEPRLRAAAALHAEGLAGRPRRLRGRLPRLHLPRRRRNPHRRALPHLGRGRHVAGARPRRRGHDAGRQLRLDHALEQRHHHPGRPARRGRATGASRT